MSISGSLSRRRMAVVINYGLLFLTLLLSLTAHLFEWAVWAKVCFCLLTIAVIATFIPLHVRTGLWRLAHAKVDALDEREMQQNLESLRHAYIVYAIASLLIILTLVVFGSSGQAQQLAVFWILLYLAHTLPSSILAWSESLSREHKEGGK